MTERSKISERTVIVVRKFAFLLLLVSLFAFAAAPAFADAASKEGWPEQLKFSAGPPGGNWFALGSTLSDMWSKNTISVTSSSAAASRTSSTATADAETSASQHLDTRSRHQGRAGLRGTRDQKRHILANLYTQYTYFVMNKSFAEKHQIKTFGDIITKKIPTRMATLKPGTGSEFVFKSLLAKGYNTNYDALKEMGCSIEFASYEGGADLMADGHLDLFVFSVGKIASIVMNIESNTDIVCLDVDQPALDALAAGLRNRHLHDRARHLQERHEARQDSRRLHLHSRPRQPSRHARLRALQVDVGTQDRARPAVKDIDELNPQIAIPDGVPMQAGAKKILGRNARPVQITLPSATRRSLPPPRFHEISISARPTTHCA